MSGNVQVRTVGQKAVLTSRYNDSPLIGGHVGGRGILLIHVVSIVHLRCVATPHQLITFTHTAVYWRLPAAQTHTYKRVKYYQQTNGVFLSGGFFPVIDFGMDYLRPTLARTKYTED